MSTLFDHGVLERAVVVRTPAYVAHLEAHVCAECGGDVSDTRGTVRLPLDRLVDSALRSRFRERGLIRIPSHGWICERHPYLVAMPAIVSRESAPGMPDGWVGVPVHFADEVTRHVAIPEREVNKE